MSSGLDIIRARMAEKKKENESSQIVFSDDELENVGKGDAGGVGGSDAGADASVDADDDIDLSEGIAPADDEEEKVRIHTVPRKTVIGLWSIALDEEFTFNVRPKTSTLYLNAMRQVISRIRRKAKQRGVPVVPCKVFLVGLEEMKTHDRVTIVRSQRASLKQKDVYDELLTLMKDPT